MLTHSFLWGKDLGISQLGTDSSNLSKAYQRANLPIFIENKKLFLIYFGVFSDGTSKIGLFGHFLSTYRCKYPRVSAAITGSVSKC